MTIPGSYVQKVRAERGLTPENVALLTGIPPAQQARIEAGQAMPSYAQRRAYARLFGFACVQAFDEGWRSSRVPLSRGEEFGRIPVINLAPAGPPQDFIEPYVDSGIGRAYIDPPPGISGPDLFAFVIDGESMEPDYPSGHYAICRPAKPEQIGEGQAVLVRFDESRDFECTFKRCYSAGTDEVELRPLNPNHPSLRVPKAQILRMSPVIAVMPPQCDEPSQPGRTQRLIGEDVHQEPADDAFDRRQ